MPDDADLNLWTSEHDFSNIFLRLVDGNIDSEHDFSTQPHSKCHSIYKW